MSKFNFLSGSSIDNSSNFLFDALQSEQCYLGFSKGTPDNQWGINTLVFIEHPSVSGNKLFPSNVAVTATPIDEMDTKFFDLNSMFTNPGYDSKRSIKISKYLNTDTGFSNPIQIPSTGILNLSYIGENWMVIQGLDKNYYDVLVPSTTESYYIENWTAPVSGSGAKARVKILNKSFVNVPFYTTDCKLWMKETSGSPYVLVYEGLQKTSNILGETYVTGMVAPESISVSGANSIFMEGVSGLYNKNVLLNATFALKDLTGNVILDNFKLVDPENGTATIYSEVSNYESSQKYATFKYLYIDGKYQYIKFIIGSNETNALAIWQEALPFTSVIPVADSNPPALEISYLKNPTVNTSIFDVNGLSKIKIGDVKFCKEMNNTLESVTASANGFDIDTIILTGENVNHVGIIKNTISVSGSTVIDMMDYHTFVIGDKIFIPYNPVTTTTPGKTYTVSSVDYTLTNSSITLSEPLLIDEPLYESAVLNSDPTSVTAAITLATTTDKDKALSYGFYNVLVDKTVPITNASSGCPTEGIYRQLFIGYKPKTSTGTLCTADIYNGDTQTYGAIFNNTTWKSDIGLLLYLSNKIPVYRKWSNTEEQFKIIL